MELHGEGGERERESADENGGGEDSGGADRGIEERGRLGEVEPVPIGRRGRGRRAAMMK